MIDFSAHFQAQKEYFYQKHIKTDVSERIKMLKQLKKWILNHETDITQALTADFGKPLLEARLYDIKPVLDEIKKAIQNLYKWTSDDTVSTPLLFLGVQAKIAYQPKGVVLILAPWNFPFNLTVGPLVSAIAAGCCVTIKPSEFTPNTSSIIQKMVAELWSPSLCHVFTGDVSVAQSLTQLPFNHIFFTGSPAVGKKVMAAAAQNLTSVTLELGGRNPVIIDETANIKDAAEKLLWSKVMNAGQSCISPNCIYVHQSVLSKFETALKNVYSEMMPPVSSDESMCGIVNESTQQKLQQWIQESIDLGAEVLVTSAEQANQVLPTTILTNVPQNAPVWQNETFGPILSLQAYNNEDKLIEKLQLEEIPLAFYVFTKRKSLLKKVSKYTHAGAVVMNDTTIQFGHPNLPFGGANNSGIGQAHGYAGFLAFSNKKPIVKQRRGFTTFKLLYPTYTPFKNKLVEMMLKWLS